MDFPITSVPLFGVPTTWITPLWMVGTGAAVTVAILIALYLLLVQAAPKIGAIARTTAKEALSQPLFYVVLALGVFALVLFPFIPYNTFGEDIKMVKDTGLTLIMVLSIFLALWTASVSIADEIEGRTALTLLSKPINRRSFILGKFLGIAVPVAILFIVLGSLFLASVSYKVAYDARETGQPAPTREQCAAEMEQIVPGLVLAFLEAIVLTSVSVAISTRLPMMANLVICVSVYVLGHLVPMLADMPGQLEIVTFIGGFLATILPVLDHFNIYNAISSGQEVPWSYVGWAGVYALLCCTAAILLSLLLFEDRDLA